MLYFFNSDSTAAFWALAEVSLLKRSRRLLCAVRRARRSSVGVVPPWDGGKPPSAAPRWPQGEPAVGVGYRRPPPPCRVPVASLLTRLARVGLYWSCR